METRPACQQDAAVTQTIHHDLQVHHRLPATYIVDTAYVSGSLLVDSQQTFGIELFGPALPDTSWQANPAQGFDVTQFHIDWEHEKATCPQGQAQRYWRRSIDPQMNPVIYICFHPKICAACPVRARCTQSNTGGRTLTLRPQAEHEAIQAARQRQQTPLFKEQYAVRAGVEGTMSQAAYALGMRRTRYRGSTRVHLQHVATAAAMNLKRAVDWLMEKQRASTRVSPLVALAA